MRRRLRHHEGEAGAEATFARFMAGLCDIKELSLILQQMTLTDQERYAREMGSNAAATGAMLLTQ